MKIIGDIGNTEVKICLIDNKYKIKKINFKTSEINNYELKNRFKSLITKKDIEMIIFSSVVPNVYNKFSNYFRQYFKKKIIEIKSLKLNKLVNINVNKKQVGSDRLANSISVIDNRYNYIIIDFGTATTFDVVI